MMGCNIYFIGEIWKIIPKLSLLPLLIWSSDSYADLHDYDVVVVQLLGFLL